eukprot:TRINITY_DN4636_c0_g1_i2.p1 TRINITY_DN4636_c0_g1~~TRINITY_DN4636_c0_g1_i2.p1  ORF type:complete len:226 (+),score=16.92 TRINITY_DN4636_c0_g1_i2:85-762(+)
MALSSLRRNNLYPKLLNAASLNTFLHPKRGRSIAGGHFSEGSSTTLALSFRSPVNPYLTSWLVNSRETRTSYSPLTVRALLHFHNFLLPSVCLRSISILRFPTALNSPIGDDDSGSAAGTEIQGLKWKNRHGKRTLVELVRPLPRWGIGCDVAKSHWAPGTFYRVTKLDVYKATGEGEAKEVRHGRAKGIFYRDGKPSTGVEERIGGANKGRWRLAKAAVAAAQT